MQIPVFYHDDQCHDACSFSKSPLKPGLMARRIALDPAFKITGNDGKDALIYPAGYDRLIAVHEAQHVRNLIDGKAEDGFGNKSAKDNKAIRFTVGNFLIAAEVAAGQPDTHPGCVWSLTSGFHHAEHSRTGGFCTYNGLNLSAWELWKYRSKTTLIIDGDAHFGNGCVDILRKMDQSHYLRYLQSTFDHDLDAWHPQAYHDLVTNLIADYDVVMYQAGADAWIGDGMGGVLTMRQIYERDEITLLAAKTAGKPIVVNLAGGYAPEYENTLRIHLNTGEAMKYVFLGQQAQPVFLDEQP